MDQQTANIRFKQGDKPYYASLINFYVKNIQKLRQNYSQMLKNVEKYDNKNHGMCQNFGKSLHITQIWHPQCGI